MSGRQRVFSIVCAVIGAILFGFLTPRAIDSLYNWLVKLNKAENGMSPNAIEVAPDVTFVGSSKPLVLIGGVLLGALIGLGFARLTLKFKQRFSYMWDRYETGDKITLYVGVFAGLVAAMPFFILLNSVKTQVYVPVAVLGITLGFSALAVYVLQSMREILPWYRGEVRMKRKGIKILDTNILIDGRICDIAKSGFLEGQIYVPRFVLEELQFIADSPDALRRQRGRRGLDVLRLLESEFEVEVGTKDHLAPGDREKVDSRLVKLAKAIGGDIVTNDFNLNQVAKLQKVHVLNLNDLSLALRTNVMPNEDLTLLISREGSQPGQGVGYLDDGTMVIVEYGKQFIGRTLDVRVSQVIQTERGKLIFAELASTTEDEVPPVRQPRQSSGK